MDVFIEKKKVDCSTWRKGNCEENSFVISVRRTVFRE